MATLLLVSNDQAEAAQLASSLREYGHHVHLEQSPRAGLTLLEEEPVDAVLADEVLPGMLAPQFIGAARASLCRPHLPAVLFSQLSRGMRDQLPHLEHAIVLPARAPAGDVAHAIARLLNPHAHRGGGGDAHAE